MAVYAPDVAPARANSRRSTRRTQTVTRPLELFDEATLLGLKPSPMLGRKGPRHWFTATDLFCGAGGTTTGFEAAMMAGKNIVDTLQVVNHDWLAIASHAANHAAAKHFIEDITKLDASLLVKTSLLWASLECFPADTLILTAAGLRPIQELVAGDMVLTHMGRWRAVTTTMQKQNAPTYTVRGQGHPGLTTTEEHPFYVRRQTRTWNQARRLYDYKTMGDPEWATTSELAKSTSGIKNRWRWATPTAIDAVPGGVPPIGPREIDTNQPEFWGLIGRWLGDGSILGRNGVENGLEISAGNHEADALFEKLSTFWDAPDAGPRSSHMLRWKRRQLRTAQLLYTCHSDLASWVVAHFGRYSYGKQLPSWVYSMPGEHRQALLDGYLSADGHQAAERTQATTVSKKLAVGVRLLAEGLGYRTSLHRYDARPETSVIEGRHVNTREVWVVAFDNEKSGRGAFADDTHAWTLGKGVEPTGKLETVYNISVEEDESYVVEGIVVHNCTNFSNAKGGQSRDADSRSLAEHMERYIRAVDPLYFCVENVREFMCFPGETAIYTKRGIIPMSEVVVGDYVMTHNSRWKAVVHKQSKMASTVRVKGLGNSIMECTPDHKFYARQLEPVLSSAGGVNRQSRPRLLEPEWVEAQHLVREKANTYEKKYGVYLWATPTSFPVYPMRLPAVVKEEEAFLYMVGRWVGDGWIRKRKTKQDLVRICCHKKESEALGARLAATGMTWSREHHAERVDVFTLGTEPSRSISPWLRNHFGEYAHKKTLPAWLFSADSGLRKAFLDGYNESDGSYCETTKLNAAVTVSRCLGVGIKLLLNSLGLKASVHLSSGPRTADFQGKTINCQQAYSVNYKDNQWSKGYVTETMNWGAVREVAPGRDEVEVFDISVEDDHSFIADGQVVHNCWGPLEHKKDKYGRPMFRSVKVLAQRHSKTGEPLFSAKSGKPLTQQVMDSGGNLVFEQVPVMVPESRTKGRDFIRWKQRIEDLGYEAHHTLLNAADYGERTSRIRLFMVFAKKGLPVRWPRATHSKNGKTVGTQPWLPVRPCLDLEVRGRSIFDRVRIDKHGQEVADPLVEKTLKRLFAGLCQYIAGSNVPTVTKQLQQLAEALLSGHSAGSQQAKAQAETEWLAKRTSNPPSGKANPGASLDQPGPAVACGFHPDLVQVQEFLSTRHHTSPESRGRSLEGPAAVVMPNDHHDLIQVAGAEREFVTQYNGGSDECRNLSMAGPINTITLANRFGVVQTQSASGEFLTNPGWPERCGGASTGEPGPTRIARQDKAPLSLVQAVGTGETGFVQKYYSSGDNVTSLNQPSGSLTCTDRMALAQVEANTPEGAWLLDNKFDNTGRPLSECGPTLLTGDHQYLAQTEAAPVAVEPKNWQFQEGDSETMRLIRLFLRAYNLSDVLLRMLMVKELLAIQGFPTDYVLKGSQSDQKRFIGNSVPPKMSQRITEALYEALQEASLLDRLTEYTGSLVVTKKGRLAESGGRLAIAA